MPQRDNLEKNGKEGIEFAEYYNTYFSIYGKVLVENSTKVLRMF